MWRGRLGLACLATMITAVLAATDAAAGEEVALTVEGVTSVTTADLDGDGVTELVVISTRDGARRAVVEVFGHGLAGWALRASLPIPPIVPSPEGDRSFRAGTDALALLGWTDAGVESVLLLSAFRGNGPDGACCLGIDHLTLRGDRLVATRVHADSSAPDSALALDFDDDGTDEVILQSEARDEGVAPPMSVLRFDESAFRPMEVPDLAGMSGPSITSMGDSDGAPGDELVLASTDESPRYARLRTDGSGGLAVEVAPPFATDPDEPMWIFSVADGALLGHTPRGIHILEWPRDAELTSARFIPSSDGRMVEPIGWSGAAALLAYDPALDSLPPGMPSALLSLDGDLIAELRPTPAVERLMRYLTRDHRAFENVGHYLYPFSGHLPGGLGDGTQVYFAAGQAVHTRPDGAIEVRPASALVDVGVLGTVGPERGWVAISDDFGWLGYASHVWLYPGPPEGSAVHIVPTETLLATEPDGGLLGPAISGAAELPPDEDGTARLATTAEGFTVSIDGPTGSRVLVVRDHSVVRQGVLRDDPIQVSILPRERDRDGHMDAAILMFTPTGQAFGVDWSIDVLRDEPAIQATGRTRDGEWSAVVSGEATPGARVSVDGAPVTVSAEGGFSATVEAGFWPRSVSVVARDVLGREAIGRVDVVGMVDYRSWPWVPILGALTVGIGALLFVRTPGRRARPAGALADEGILEEIDAG